MLPLSTDGLQSRDFELNEDNQVGEDNARCDNEAIVGDSKGWKIVKISW